MKTLEERLVEWKELSDMRDKADDYTRCPRCKGQLYFCNCTEELADELLLNHYDKIKRMVDLDGITSN
jgi:uncharacterized protein with PIN domain